jgi:amidohydrolase
VSTPANFGQNLLHLTETDLAEITAFRRHLHTMPDVSGEEHETARAVVDFIAPTRPDQLITGLGGHGVAAVFDGGGPGPTVLLRADIDGLPILDLADVPHRSKISGRGHLCGHDGHTATLAAIARHLAVQRPARGRIVLMFQPAEENGAGARAVVADPRFASIQPDISFAYHNMPGVAFGQVWVDAGPVNCASRGMKIRLTGTTAHAARPEDGISPMPAISSLMPALAAFSSGNRFVNDFVMATVTHVRMGEPVFGISPGSAEIFVTLRTLIDSTMAALVARAESLAKETAAAHGLTLDIAYDDVFAHVENAPAAVAYLRSALDAEGITHERGDLPFKASEDFGIFGQKAPAAMFFLGAGESYPALHTPLYDFPDALIPIAARVLINAARQVVG